LRIFKISLFQLVVLAITLHLCCIFTEASFFSYDKEETNYEIAENKPFSVTSLFEAMGTFFVKQRHEFVDHYFTREASTIIETNFEIAKNYRYVTQIVDFFYSMALFFKDKASEFVVHFLRKEVCELRFMLSISQCIEIVDTSIDIIKKGSSY
jgi:hypothetical protein